MSTIRLVVCAIALAASACSENAATTTSPTTTEAASVLFTGTLQPRATRFYSYSLTTAGPVTAMLASLESGGAPMNHKVELGLGVPAGTGCAVSVASQTTTSLVPQIRQDAPVGTYCVRISDTEGLPGPMSFTIRLIHP